MPPYTAPAPLVTRLLIMPDGTVLADNLTREMASCLEEMGLYPDPSTRCALKSGRPPNPPAQHRLVDPVEVSLHTSTNAGPTDI